MPYLIAILLVIIDQLTKYIFYNKWLFSFCSLFWHHVFNKGFSWWISIFPNYLLIFITVIVLWIFFYLYKKKYIWPITFTLLLAGWLGNLIDRIYLWWVRDFITLVNFFPTFNLADVYITLWAIMIFIESLDNE